MAVSPSLSQRMESHDSTVESLWAIIASVIDLGSEVMVFMMAASTPMSSELVASSRIRIGAFFKMAWQRLHAVPRAGRAEHHHPADRQGREVQL